VAQHQENDFAAEAQDTIRRHPQKNEITDCNNDFINCNNRVNNNLLSIEEILDSILHHEILMKEDQNAEAVLQDLDKLALDTSESCISSKQSRLNNDASNS